MSNFVVRVERLTKIFSDVTAVDNISFCIEKGKITGILGTNGAGKTTTITMMLGLLLPTSGSIEILSQNMLEHRYKILSRINFSSPYVDLPKRLTVEQNLRVYCMLYGIKKIKDKIEKLSTELDFKKLLNMKTGDLSSGQKTRVSIAKALINDPEVLFLDEPTASLDPDTADRIRTYLEEINKKKWMTILLASHNMNEIERMCDDVLMMRSGKIVDRGHPKHLIEKHGRFNLEDVFLKMARGQ